MLFPKNDLQVTIKIFVEIFPADCKLYQDLFLHAFLAPKRQDAGSSSTWLNLYQELMKDTFNSAMKEARMNLLPAQFALITFMTHYPLYASLLKPPTTSEECKNPNKNHGDVLEWKYTSSEHISAIARRSGHYVPPGWRSIDWSLHPASNISMNEAELAQTLYAQLFRFCRANELKIT